MIGSYALALENNAGILGTNNITSIILKIFNKATQVLQSRAQPLPWLATSSANTVEMEDSHMKKLETVGVA